MRLWAASAEFPLMISHNDCHTRNLFINHRDESELIAVDWASVGLTPAGVDGGSLITSGLTWGREEARLVVDVEQQTFDSYYEGLVEAGWQRPRDQVRLVFLTMAATYANQMIGVVY